jgi:peptidoglycan-associated lipoprotein
MRNHKLLLAAFVLLAVGLLAAGCAKHQLTKSDTARLDAIAAKIAEAERIGAPDCIPYKDVAYAKVALEHAQHEMIERWETSEADVKAADAAADAALAKAKACVAARPKPVVEAPPPPPPTPAPAPAPPPPPPMVEEKAELPPVYFDFDKSFIRDDAKPALQKVAEFLKKEKGAKIQVQGNCDERGTAEYNMALGDRRAASAKKYLVGLGVDGSRVSTISYGKEKPQCTEHNEGCWQKNRRGDFVVQK